MAHLQSQLQLNQLKVDRSLARFETALSSLERKVENTMAKADDRSVLIARVIVLATGVWLTWKAVSYIRNKSRRKRVIVL